MAKAPSRRAATKKKTPPPPPPFELADWYSSEEAKRRFARICQTVNEEGRSIELLGTEDYPYLCLSDIEMEPAPENAYEITIEKAVADWSSVTNAALYFGTVFRIRGKRVLRAVLRRHPVNQPASFEYGRPQVEHLTDIASQMLEKQAIALAEQREVLDAQRKATERFEAIWREFQKMWREANKLPPQG